MAIGFILQSGELPPGGLELLVILLIAMLLFGANKMIPKLGRSLGGTMDEFEKGRKEVKEELQREREDSSSKPDTSSTESSNSKSTATPSRETKVFDSADEDGSDTRVFDPDDR